jgi:hypothetical protein
VTWAATTSKKRNIEFPCLVMWPSRRRFPAGLFQRDASSIALPQDTCLLPVMNQLQALALNEGVRCKKRAVAGTRTAADGIIPPGAVVEKALQ